MAAGDQYPVVNRENLKIPIKMQLSQKRKTFSQFFSAFLKSTLVFEHFEKKDNANRSCVSEITDSENVVRKSPVSDTRSTSNMVNGTKHYRNLHHRTMIIFIDHCQSNWVVKSLSYWHPKSWYRLLTHWLPMTSILFLIEKT